MLKSLFALLFVGVSSFAAEKDVKRSTASAVSDSAWFSVVAADLPSALKKISSNQKVKTIIRMERKKYADCDGTLGKLDAKSALNFYNGKSNASNVVVGYLVPIFGGCSGTGMIEEAKLLAKIVVKIDLEKDDTEVYEFQGFVRVKTIAGETADYSSGLAD